MALTHHWAQLIHSRQASSRVSSGTSVFDGRNDRASSVAARQCFFVWNSCPTRSSCSRLTFLLLHPGDLRLPVPFLKLRLQLE